MRGSARSGARRVAGDAVEAVCVVCGRLRCACARGVCGERLSQPMTALGSQLTRLASNRSPTTGRICLWIVRTARRQAQIVRCQTQRRAALHQAAITHQQSAIHTRRDGVAPFEGRVGGVRVNTHTLSGVAAVDSWLCCRKARRRASACLSPTSFRRRSLIFTRVCLTRRIYCGTPLTSHQPHFFPIACE